MTTILIEQFKVLVYTNENNGVINTEIYLLKRKKEIFEHADFRPRASRRRGRPRSGAISSGGDRSHVGTTAVATVAATAGLSIRRSRRRRCRSRVNVAGERVTRRTYNYTRPFRSYRRRRAEHITRPLRTTGISCWSARTPCRRRASFRRLLTA